MAIKSPSESDLPFVTVIMPIRNEAAYIERSLGAVLNQDYPSDRMEVLVVDGMSDDGTRAIVRRIVAKTEDRGRKADPSVVHRPSSVVLLDNPKRIVPTALNIGLRHARGDVIIRVDGHCEIPTDYIRRCVEGLDTLMADCLGGQLLTVGETPIAQTIALAQSSPFGVGNARFRVGAEKPGPVDTLAFGAYRRDVFQRIGGFDEDLVRNQDYEFNYRLRRSGGRIFLLPELKVRYYSRANLRRLWRQYFQYGYWKVRMLAKHPRSLRPRQMVPPLFVAWLVSLTAAGTVWRPAWTLLAATAMVYGVTTLLVSAYIAYRSRAQVEASRWRVFLWLPLVFAILHIGWGLGFWWGLLTLPLPPYRVPGSGAPHIPTCDAAPERP